MDALEFARELKRMCEFYSACRDCPAVKQVCGDVLEFESLVPIVEQWSAEHPPVRNVDWVAEQLEKIGYRVNKDRLGRMCPVSMSSVFFTSDFTHTRSCGDRFCGECRKWWLEEHREEKENGTR